MQLKGKLDSTHFSLEKNLCVLKLLISGILLAIISVISIIAYEKANDSKEQKLQVVYVETEEIPLQHVETEKVISSPPPVYPIQVIKEAPVPELPDICYEEDELYQLAKIAMAEAEGESTEGKALVILSVLNRQKSDKFPNDIEDIIMQTEPSRQYSSTEDGGRYWTNEPNQDCWKALEMVMGGWDESQGALYFESESESTWHSKHLEYLFKSGNHYFYKDKE